MHPLEFHNGTDVERTAPVQAADLYSDSHGMTTGRFESMNHLNWHSLRECPPGGSVLAAEAK